MMASALLAPVAVAKQVYRYTDEQGILHFTDTPPATDQPVRSRRVRVDPKPLVTAETSTLNGRSRLVMTNRLYGPVQVELKFTQARNVVAEPRLPARLVLPEGYRGEPVRFRARLPKRSAEWAIQSRMVPGQAHVTHDDTYAYLPPFPEGMAFRVSQGFHGERTHRSEQARYAVDIPMPEGTPLRAARDGVVMHVEEDFFESGDDIKRYGARANQIRVLHGDGTMGVYAHLAPERVRVAPGDVVLAGEVIAESGDTGYSTGPHLHFVVQRNAGMVLESVPFRFAAQEHRRIRPLTGVMLHGLPAEAAGATR